MSGRRRAGGFSLIELAVASTVLLLGLLLAADLLTESAHRFAEAGRELRQPLAPLTERLLRQDLEAARGALGAEVFWTSAALLLERADGSQVAYTFDGTSLTRGSFAPDGRALGERPLLTPLLLFRWRAPVPGLLEVELSWARERFSPYRAGTARWRDRSLAIETIHLLVAPRGGGLGGAW